MSESASATQELRAAIDRSGYYPDVVADALETCLAGERVVSYFVHHEPTFYSEEVRRHITVLVLTPSRLILGHTDEHPADETLPTPYATASTEAVPIDRVSSIVVSRVVANPAAYEPGGPVHEAILTIGWGAMGRLDLEPAACSDPNCEADHGYTGTFSSDDLTLRVSSAAEGGDAVGRLLGFAQELSVLTRRPPQIR
ncbi:DUF5998 family protein [Actinopolymorpha pittospori]|jgi:hypothetical protein|uniref:Phosphodiesterase n=1 Tax=Actinopolymorpha pittospori TaxID=648752 RepID=A0A927N1V7_9ACTN|nr:DUF5998 family protein [Actinopolymorpha pittospori]MBE1610514.1 hypothetical protein [Actinopolymorpha pittospori]